MFLRAAVSSVLAAMPFSFSELTKEQVMEGILPKRQLVGTGVTSSATSSEPVTTPEPTSSDTPITTSQPPTTSDEPSTTTPEPTTTTPAPSRSTPSSAPITTSSPVTSASASSIVDLGSTTIDRNSLTSDTVVSSPLVATHTEVSTFSSVFTSDGAQFTSEFTSAVLVSSTTGFTTSTITPTLADAHSGGSGLSSTSKDIIGGVVGGVGGAILIGGLAIVAWRLWGKKKRERQAVGDSMWDPQQDMLHQDKREPELPFSSSYSNPGGSVNHASNF